MATKESSTTTPLLADPSKACYNVAGHEEKEPGRNGSNGAAKAIDTTRNGRGVGASSPAASLLCCFSIQSPKTMLYIAHAVSQFAELSWQFSLTLFLAAMAHLESLLLVSAYGLISWGSLLLFSSAMARYFVDTIPWNRRTAFNALIVAENTMVIAGCFVSYWIFRSDDYVAQQQQQQQQQDDDGTTIIITLRTVLLTILFATGSIALVLEQTMVVVIERDWLIVVARHEATTTTTSTDSLGEMNVMVKQIDLACKVLTPAFSGWLIGWLQPVGESDNIHDLSKAALALGILNAIAMVVEYALMTRLYDLVPGLANRHETDDDDVEKDAGDSPKKTKTAAAASTTTTTKGNMCNDVRIYFQQAVAAAGVALALLYFNALTFGGLMTAYLLSRGMSMGSVGLWRGLSAISGLCGTFVFGHLRQRFSLVTVGFASILTQTVILTVGVSCLYLPSTLLNFSTATYVLVGAVITSRIGVYGFDIAVTQLMQEQIPAPIRGVIGGTQKSLNAAFQLASFVLSLAFQNPKDFPVYATIGYLGTVVATILFGGRMLHFQPPSNNNDNNGQ